MEGNSEQTDQYKSYIQRRRAVPDESEENTTYGTGALKSQPNMTETSDDEFDSGEDFSSQDFIFRYDREGSSPDRETSVSSLKRADPGIYQRLVGQRRKNAYISRNTYTPQNSYAPYSRYNNRTASSAHGALAEDNRSTVLAVKIIKQTLVCFFLLGLIVLMQQRNDTESILAFVRKHIIDTHIEPDSLYSLVEGFVQECSRLLGGSP